MKEPLSFLRRTDKDFGLNIKNCPNLSMRALDKKCVNTNNKVKSLMEELKIEPGGGEKVDRVVS